MLPVVYTTCQRRAWPWRGQTPSIHAVLVAHAQVRHEQPHHAATVEQLAALAQLPGPKMTALYMELPSLVKLILWMNSRQMIYIYIYSLKGALRGVAKTLHLEAGACIDLLQRRAASFLRLRAPAGS